MEGKEEGSMGLNVCFFLWVLSVTRAGEKRRAGKGRQQSDDNGPDPGFPPLYCKCRC